MAIEAIEPLFNFFENDNINIFVDCRSSALTGGPAPTYKLAKMANLSSTLPFSLNYQGGAEVSQALLFLDLMKSEMGKGAILSASQKVNPLDQRKQKDGFPLADGSVALIVSDKISFTRGFRILGVSIGQRDKEWDATLEGILQDVCKKAGIKPHEIGWSIIHRMSKSFLMAAKKVLPHAREFKRDIFPNFDFGCADSLISLSRLVSTSPPSSDEIGIIWFSGRFGAAGAVILDSTSTSISLEVKC